MATESQSPVARFRVGSIEAAVWEQEEGRYSISIKKSYKDKQSGDWKETRTLFPDDIPKLQLVLQQAYEFCVLKQD